jgi:Oxidoreductase family, NAD-binding Rossmann fold
MQRLTVAIIGCGLITQVEHLPNLLALKDHFEVIGVADPSPSVRAHLAQLQGVETFATAQELFDQKPNCVVIATPDAYHVELTLSALAQGINVFVEKPLCYDPADAARIAAARDRAGKIVQVGYMKRFDPAYIALCDLLRRQQTELRAVNVEVLDPDFWPFIAHRTVLFGDDVPPSLIQDNSNRRSQQISAALGFSPSADGIKGYAGPLCSSLVHDVNLVNGALSVLNRSIASPVAAAIHGADAGVAIVARVAGTGAPVSMSWHAVPKLAHYSERLTFAFEDAVFELHFPSPYLNHQPTKLIERRSRGLAYGETVHRPSYAEAFVEEMGAFHAAVTQQASSMNSVEEAGADVRLLVALGRLALSNGTSAANATAL